MSLKRKDSEFFQNREGRNHCIPLPDPVPSQNIDDCEGSEQTPKRLTKKQIQDIWASFEVLRKRSKIILSDIGKLTSELKALIEEIQKDSLAIGHYIDLKGNCMNDFWPPDSKMPEDDSKQAGWADPPFPPSPKR
jgi:hypothetical protein